MQNTKTKMITALLLLTLTLAAFPLAVHASTGNIFINSTTTSVAGQLVAAGANVSLYFGTAGTPVTFSGAQFYLMMSTDGFAQVSTNDIKYTAYFDVFNLTSVTTISHYINATGGYKWDVGYGWVNGTIYSNLAGGNYWIKAFDGTSTSVAVTDTFITITGAIIVSPTSGNPGTPLTISGFAFPANSLLNLTYLNPLIGAPFISIVNLTTVNSLGQFTYTLNAPDLLQALAAGQQPIANNTITFRVQNATGSVATYDAFFAEFVRGLAQVRVTGTGGSQQNAAAGTLFGNNTLFTLTGTNPITGIGVTKTLRIAGNYFFSGDVVTRWDNAVVTNSAPTANASGWFNTTLVVPPAVNGLHNITITDANNVVFTLFVTVVPSLTLSPTSGPTGTTVTATGYGFTAPTTGVVNNASIAWPGLTAYRGSALVDATGSFITTFTVPNSLGGDVVVSALENATGTFVSIATATFTVSANFIVTPGSFANNASLLVVASGTGFKTAPATYQVNIDNQLFGFAPLGSVFQTGTNASTTGVISITFVGAGFTVGTHVISLYENGSTTPAAYAGFNVTSDPVGSSAMLEAINNTVTHLGVDTNSILTNVASVNNTVLAIQTSIGGLATASSVTALGGQLTAIQNSIAAISIPNMGSITTSLASISATLGTVSGDTAVIRTTVGELTTSLAAINTIVTRIDGNTATLSTDLGTLSGTVTSISGNVATIQTGIGTLTADISGLETSMTAVQSDVSSSKAATDSLSPLVIVAIVLALIAALAAIASIVLMRRKIAG
jgi:hypothetical protein